MLELTYNYGVDKYEMGTAYGHIAIEVPDAQKACEEVRKRGGTVTREAGPVKGGTTVIAFVQDPDGYKIELIERDRLARANPRVRRCAIAHVVGDATDSPAAASGRCLARASSGLVERRPRARCAASCGAS